MIKSSTTKNQHVLIAIIMIVAALLRFYDLAAWSLSNDELSALNRLRFDTLDEMIREGVKLNDFHPAGVQVFLWFWTKLFGDAVWIIRMPFAICGVLSVWFTWLIGKRWFGASAALPAAAAMAFLQYPILYSQLARPYAPGLLFSLVTVWYFTKIIFDKKESLATFGGFSLFAALTAYTHNYSFLFVLIVGASGLFFFKRINLKKYLLASFIAAILYLPHLHIFLYQFGIGGVGGDEGWLGKPDPDWILQFLWYVFNKSYVLLLIMAGAFLFSIYKLKKSFSAFHLLALTWFLALFFVGYFYSIFRNPILQYSILIFAFPYLLMFIFSGMSLLKPRIVIILSFILLAFGTVNTTLINKFYEQQHFGEFKGVAEDIASWNRQFGPSNVSNAIVVNAPYYIHFYLDKMESGIKFEQYDNRGNKDFKNLVQILDTILTEYFVYAWTKPAPPEVELIIREYFPCILQSKNYSGLSKAMLFGKRLNDSCLSYPESTFIFTRTFNPEEGDFAQYRQHLSDEIFQSAPFSFKLDSLAEYAPGYRAVATEINDGIFDLIEIEVSAYSQMEIEKAIIVLSLEDENGTYLWRSSPLHDFILPDKWGKGYLIVRVHEIKSPKDVLAVYIWNPGKSTFFIDDIKIRFLDNKTHFIHK